MSSVRDFMESAVTQQIVATPYAHMSERELTALIIAAEERGGDDTEAVLAAFDEMLED